MTTSQGAAALIGTPCLASGALITREDLACVAPRMAQNLILPVRFMPAALAACILVTLVESSHTAIIELA